MTRKKIIYIALDTNNVPIVSAETFQNLKEGLDEYYGVDKGHTKCEGWFPFDTEYPDEYVGYYKYYWNYPMGDKIDEGIDNVKVYCMILYPITPHQSTYS